MQPTMKLRWKKVDSLFKGELHIVNSYGEKHVLQQWWEGSSMGKTNIGWGEIAIGTIKGEWRDIPIEVEE